MGTNTTIVTVVSATRVEEYIIDLQVRRIAHPNIEFTRRIPDTSVELI